MIFDHYTRYTEEPIQFDRPSGRHALDLTWHLDARGGLMELFRESWFSSAEPGDHLRFERFSLVRQAYISTTAPGVVKAWHLHAHQEDRFVCLRGRVLLATWRPNCPGVRERVLDAGRRPQLVRVPPGTAHGWLALGQEEAWILNLVSHEYDGTDEWRRPAHDGPAPDVPYNWHRSRDG